MGPEQAIRAEPCFIAENLPLRCIFTAICRLAAKIDCGVGHDAGITASAMPLVNSDVDLLGLWVQNLRWAKTRVSKMDARVETHVLKR